MEDASPSTRPGMQIQSDDPPVAELRQDGKDWEPTNDRTVAKLVTTIAKRFSYSVHRGEAPLKYGRDNWNLNF